jgi:3-oxoacyl-ACP reductase-like protein
MPIRCVLLATVLVLLLAPAALAQSAGDDQYSDPFGEQQQESTPTPEPAQPAQAPAAPPAPAPVPAAPAAAAAPAQAAQLPRTGWDAAVPATLGLILLAAGVALRVRVRRAR